MLGIIRTVSIVVIGLLIGILVLWEVLTPFKKEVALRYIERGDRYLLEELLQPALDSYNQALRFDPANQTAVSRQQMTMRARTDALAMRGFVQDHGMTAAAQRLESALYEYEQPKDALIAGVDLYQRGYYSYARYPVERALEIDRYYTEAWHYLGLICGELAKIDSEWQECTEKAWSERDKLSTEYLEG